MVIIAQSDMENGTIPDVVVRRLAAEGGSLTILRGEDHLLRRFGQAEHLSLEAGGDEGFRLRETADEYLAFLNGAGTLELVDARPSSPAFQLQSSVQVSAPAAVLVPWGVAYRVQVSQAMQVLRFSTHAADRAESERRWSLEALRARGEE
jgi:dTDP-4-dehydrorhamnose 3,5-epimerase-like enzyme